MPFKFNPLGPPFDEVNAGSSGSVNIPELSADPASPTAQEAWVLKTTTGGGGSAGQLMGILGLTYAGGGTTTYQFSYYTNEGTIVRTPLS